MTTWRPVVGGASGTHRVANGESSDDCTGCPDVGYMLKKGLISIYWTSVTHSAAVAPHLAVARAPKTLRANRYRSTTHSAGAAPMPPKCSVKGSKRAPQHPQRLD